MEQALLGLKALFVVLLYLFIWRVIRGASKDLQVPQESFVLAPSQARAAGFAEATARPASLVVLRSPSLASGKRLEAGAVPLTIGRSRENTVALDADEFASSRHVRIESQRDGVWVLDLDSTNGTWVNGERLDGRRRLHEGDVVRVGETELRFEQ